MRTRTSSKEPTKKRKPKKLAEAEREFWATEDSLKEFKQDNYEFMEELIQLVAERERARERLTVLVGTLEFGAGGMKISITNKRTFDGRHLWTHLPPELRDELVEVVYKVDTKKFDRAVKNDEIAEDVLGAAIANTERSTSILKKIKPINLG